MCEEREKERIHIYKKNLIQCRAMHFLSFALFSLSFPLILFILFLVRSLVFSHLFVTAVTADRSARRRKIQVTIL